MAEELLEATGWITTTVKGSRKWNESVDFFNRFDIIAVHPTKEPFIRFIQVKKNKRGEIPGMEERLRIAEFRTMYGGQCAIEIWAFKDRVKEPRIILL